MRAWHVAAGVVVGAGAVAALLNVTGAQERKDRETKVREDRSRVADDGFWIYDDLPRGIAESKASGKPLLVVFRCIPCEACSQIDEQVVEGHAVVRPLLEKFVRVRVPKANEMDLALFEFDCDLSWAAFLLAPDLTIYGRYGSRSAGEDSEGGMSLEGFRKALEGALDLHARLPEVRASLAAKRGPDPAQKRPQDFPTLAGRTESLDWEGKVVPSCIHCHQVGEARRIFHRTSGRPMPPEVLYPFPHPRALGLDLDPRERARVRNVAPGSSAEKDGFRAGDDLATLEGQPILSIADVQWVLHRAGETGSLRAEILRDGKKAELAVTLAPGWREKDDLSWRSTTWDLRRMAAGGLLLEEVPADGRRAAGLGEDALALRAAHVGEYGEHAVAKKAGFRKGDVVVAVDGRTERLSEQAMLASLVRRTKPGDRVTFTVLRDGKRLEMSFAMQ